MFGGCKSSTFLSGVLRSGNFDPPDWNSWPKLSHIRRLPMDQMPSPGHKKDQAAKPRRERRQPNPGKDREEGALE